VTILLITSSEWVVVAKYQIRKRKAERQWDFLFHNGSFLPTASKRDDMKANFERS
jgi:hypothetical protein